MIAFVVQLVALIASVIFAYVVVGSHQRGTDTFYSASAGAAAVLFVAAVLAAGTVLKAVQPGIEPGTELRRAFNTLWPFVAALVVPLTFSLSALGECKQVSGVVQCGSHNDYLYTTFGLTAMSLLIAGQLLVWIFQAVPGSYWRERGWE